MITAQAIIDLGALQHNYANLKGRLDNQKLVAVVKGDAYGHNAIEVAKALPQADMFAVSRIEEAVELRNAGIPQPILLLEGCFCKEDLETAAELELHTAIHCQETLRDLESAELSKPISVWLKVDTGMHRIGVQPHEVSDYVSKIERTGKIAGHVGFMSHFSCADDLNSPATKQQIELFKKATKQYAGPKTLANSAGILLWQDAYFQVCRGGIAIYGVSPCEGETGAKYGLKPVMSLKSKLIAVRHHQANQPVGYSQTWTSPRDTIMGVIAMGYGDGFPRTAPQGTPVYINGRKVPISGRVSMDMITVDLGPNSQDKVGDDVEFWGNNLPVEEVAAHIGTIPYELMIKLTKRVDKRFIK
ncbi:MULTISPECIES: alanine racemase [Vibrio]|uniref:Alanine racemase n=2 Tax=Vibrio TaxID=662 RepID=A0A7X4LHD4_9VIBR|nr:MULTISPECIES: alanine racemase [Vibrio]MBF9003255.1 alanine racemase [Vibrio nitrifigilis]MZI91978.1 alanine racemase [Vibrio eleionomae]